MKIITWNIHGAQKDSAVWDELLNFDPDIALLQEVGAFPAQLADTFDIVSRPAIYKTGRPQRFSTAVLVRGKILEEVALSSEFAWVNHELEFFKGNLISCRVQPKDRQPLIVVSVYSPAWAVGRERLKEVDVSQVKTKVNPDVWVTDILWAALQNTISGNDTWVVGGDCNSCETFDADWQDRNKRLFSIRSSGNAEMLDHLTTGSHYPVCAGISPSLFYVFVKVISNVLKVIPYLRFASAASQALPPRRVCRIFHHESLQAWT